MVCEDIPTLPVINCTFTPSEEDFIKVYTVKDYDACMTNLENVVINEWGMTNEDLDGICKGTGDISYGDSTQINIESIIANNYFTEQELIDLNVINVEKSDDLNTGTEFVHGQYTYTYKMALSGEYNHSTYIDGWSVTLTNKESTEPVTSEVCTYINDEQVISASKMFYKSKASKIDLSNFNTSNITDMSSMFAGSTATNLDLSSFDTSKVTGMFNMFYECDATTGYARTQADADKFNSSFGKPSTLTFVVKDS